LRHRDDCTGTVKNAFYASPYVAPNLALFLGVRLPKIKNIIVFKVPYKCILNLFTHDYDIYHFRRVCKNKSKKTIGKS